MTITIRRHEVPNSSVIFWLKNACPPCDYTHNANLQARYVKNVLNSCTNPGSTCGSNAHTHASTGAHLHCVTGTHTHVIGSGLQSGFCPGFNIGPVSKSPANHSHTRTTNSGGASANSSCTGAHTQPSENGEPIHKQFKYVTKNGNISLRRKDVPSCGIILWTKPIACIPSHFTHCVSTVDRFIKGTATSCVTPGCLGGNATHQHAVEGAHTHTDTIASHTHANPGGWPATGGAGGNTGAGSTYSAGPHAHGGAPPTSGSSAECCSVSDCKTHQHGSQCNNPNHITTSLLKKTIHSLRVVGIPTKGVVMWEGTLAAIPSGFALQDGTLGTTNTLDDFLRIIPTACTNPGVGAGANCHGHSAACTHLHNFSSPHNHTEGAHTLSASPCRAGSSGGGNPVAPRNIHTHVGNTTTGGGSSRCSVTGGSHTHTDTDGRPDYTDVALIERTG